MGFQWDQSEGSSTLSAGLYVVATPIGNLADISLRALNILSSADFIAAEDTRRTQLLLRHYGIKAKLHQYHDYSHASERGYLLEQLKAGKTIALVSDAGSPLIADPGYKLVCDVEKAGVSVTVIPGACALICALSLSGLPTDQFIFAGFLPRKPGARQRQLIQWKNAEPTLVCYESPRRVGQTLHDMFECFGDRKACVLRELTKKFETIDSGLLSVLSEKYQEGTKGEVVIVVEGGQPSSTEEKEALRLLQCANKYLSTKDAAGLVAEITDLPKRDLYQQLLAEQTRDD